MASYPPPPAPAAAAVDAAEEYELTSPRAATSTLPPPPTGRPSMQRARSRTLTLHPNASSALLFAAPGSSGVARRQQRRRASSGTQRGHAPSGSGDGPASPTARFGQSRNHFLTDELDHLGPDTEQVKVPDFGHMLGMDTGEDHYAIAEGMKSRSKRKLYLLLEEASSGREAFYIHIIITGAIIFSVILTTLSTLPAFHTSPASVKTLFGLDTTIVVLFTFEYLARAYAHSDSWSQFYRWFTSFFAITDLLSILPYYIEVARNDDTSIMFRFSILRTFRLLRVFRAFRYENQMLLTIEVMYVAVRRSKEALIAITYFILLVLVLFSTLIYFAERGTWDSTLGAFVDADGDVSSFDSIPQTAWYALVTMSTAGYGDVVPKSALGKILSVPLLMFGLLLIALPSFVLGRNFAIVHDAMVNIVPRQGQSQDASPRASWEQELDRESKLTPVDEREGAPLLPISTSTPSRGESPPGSGANSASTSRPTMWHPDLDGRSGSLRNRGTSQTPGQAKDSKDLTNTKLAKNQLVLLDQIDSLRRTVERQGDMLQTLMVALAAREGIELPKDKGKGKEVARNEEQREQFGIGGDSDDEEPS